MKALLNTNVIIRTVTLYTVGHVDAIGDGFITLSKAAWVADTGRWSSALATGKLNEVEMFPGDGVTHVALGAIVDVTPWAHPLPTVTV